MNYVILDIETVPRKELHDTIELEIKKRVQRKLERSDLDPVETESLVRSISPFFGKVLCIGLRWYSTNSKTQKDKVICGETEKETLEQFFQIINNERTQNVRFVHYNGLGFDIPFLIIRAIHYGIPVTNSRFKNQRRFSFDSHIDLMMYLSGWSNFNAVSLDIACLSLGIPSPKEGEVTGSSVAQAYESGNLDAVREYVMRDVEATFQLFLKLKEYI